MAVFTRDKSAPPTTRSAGLLIFYPIRPAPHTARDSATRPNAAKKAGNTMSSISIRWDGNEIARLTTAMAPGFRLSRGRPGWLAAVPLARRRKLRKKSPIGAATDDPNIVGGRRLTEILNDPPFTSRWIQTLADQGFLVRVGQAPQLKGGRNPCGRDAAHGQARPQLDADHVRPGDTPRNHRRPLHRHRDFRWQHLRAQACNASGRLGFSARRYRVERGRGALGAGPPSAGRARRHEGSHQAARA